MKLLETPSLEPLIEHKESWREYILESKLDKILEKYKKNNKMDSLREGVRQKSRINLLLQVSMEVKVVVGQESKHSY